MLLEHESEPPASRPSPQWRPGQPLPSVWQPIPLDMLLEMFGVTQLQRHDFLRGPLEDTALLDEWVENYRQGIPGTVGISLYQWQDGEQPVGLTILVGDGSAVYTIYSFSLHGNEAMWAPEVFQSSYIVMREYDYIFGPDIPAESSWARDRRFPTIIHRSFIDDLNDFEMISWNPAAGPMSGGISLSQAEARAREVHEKRMQYISVVETAWTGGWYFRENVLDLLNAGILYHMYGDISELHYKTVGAVSLGGNTYYLVYAHRNLQALNRLAELLQEELAATGQERYSYWNISARAFNRLYDSGEFDEDFWGDALTEMLVGLDGRLVFEVSEHNLRAIFIHDVGQEVVAP